MAKRRPIVPSQRKLSVQDIRAVGTPEGTAMENDEMRRIQMALNRVVDEVDGLKSTAPAPVESSIPSDSGEGDGGTTTITEVNNYYGTDLRMLSGTVWVNRLPQEAPLDYGAEQEYLYQSIDYTPYDGKCGYYVYATIRHNWGLANKDNYVLHLVDQEHFVSDNHINQVAIPEDEGWDENMVIIRGVYKPTDQRLEFDTQGNLLTNLKFRFVLIEKPVIEGVPDIEHSEAGWILRGEDGKFWRLSIDADGAMITSVFSTWAGDADLLVLFDGANYWKVGVDSEGSLTTSLTTHQYPMRPRLSSGGTLYLLEVDQEGTLTTS